MKTRMLVVLGMVLALLAGCVGVSASRRLPAPHLLPRRPLRRRRPNRCALRW